MWREGIPLAQAVEEFTEPRAPRRRKAKPSGLGPPSIDGESDADRIARAAQQLQEWAAENQRLLEPLHQRQAELVESLRSGELVAVGFLKGAPSEFTEIPPGLFDQRFFKWSNSRVVGHGFTYEQVHVAESARGSTARPQPPANSTNDGGRPSRRDDIERAIREIEQAKPKVSVFAMTAKELATAVLEHLRIESRDAKGFSSETIRRVANTLRGKI